MNEPKFTPGPWTIEISHSREHGNYPAILVGRGRILTANCYDKELSKEEMEANAKLVAAAPEMFEALKEISEGKGRYHTDKLIHAANTIEDMKNIALEIIKKATE